MRFLTIMAAAAALGGVLLAGAPARAQNYPWCAQYGNHNGGRNCGFASYRQCMAAISGNGGYCTRNTFFRGAYAEGRMRHRRW